MKFFENRRKPGEPISRRCGYCRAPGHTKIDCPQVAKDWESWRNYVVPHTSDTLKTAHYWVYPKYWGEWFTKCRNEMEARKRRAASGPRSTTSERHCGWCNTPGHTRRTCEDMKEFLELCYRANYNWRLLAGRYMEESGLTVGSAIQVNMRTAHGFDAPREKTIALVQHVNRDKLSVCCAFDANRWTGLHVDQFMNSLEVLVALKGKGPQHLAFPGAFGSRWNNSTEPNSPIEKFFKHGAYWGADYGKPLSPIRNTISEEWLNGYREAFQYLVKKKSRAYLKEIGFVDLIEHWATEEGENGEV